MSCENSTRTSLYLVRLKIFEWVKFHRKHLHQIQGNLAGRNFVADSRVNSRLITHARMQTCVNLKSTAINGFNFRIGGFHVTSSPPCWWTVNKRSLISSLCLSTSICSFHHCYLCLPRLHENHL